MEDGGISRLHYQAPLTAAAGGHEGAEQEPQEQQQQQEEGKVPQHHGGDQGSLPFGALQQVEGAVVGGGGAAGAAAAADGRGGGHAGNMRSPTGEQVLRGVLLSLATDTGEALGVRMGSSYPGTRVIDVLVYGLIFEGTLPPPLYPHSGR